MARKHSSYSAKDQLAGMRAKIDRAEELLDAVDVDIGKWVSSEHPWKGRAEIGEGNKRFILALVTVKPIPPRFGVIGGEVVHDLRSTLDHLVCYIVKANHFEPTLATAWPFETSRYSWRRKVERRQTPIQFWRKKGGGPLKGIPIGCDAWALIEGTQPYLRGDSARNQMLWRLHRLWNADKHRIIHTTPISASTDSLLNCITVPAGIRVIERKALIGPGKPVQDGTKLALFRVDRPVPANMEVEFELTFQISLGDDEWGDTGLRDALTEMRTLIDEVEALAPPSN